jgi:toxin ParE1/3/4
MQLLITPLAAFDLEEIGDHIAQDNPIRAGTFVAELRAQCEKICLNPAGYRRRPELSDGLRSCAHGNCVIFLSLRQSMSPLFAYCTVRAIFLKP